MDSTLHLKMQSQGSGGRSLEGLSSMQEMVKAFEAGTLGTWTDVIRLSHQ
jgi:hypothetical protein